MCRAYLTLIIFLSMAFQLELTVPPSLPAEIYKYVDAEGVIHFSNLPDGKYDWVLKDGWMRFRLGTDFEKYDSAIWKAAERYKVDYALIKAIIKVESNFNSRATSRVGAKGLMQLMPETAGELGVKDIFQPEENIFGGVRHLRYLLDLFGENLQLALAGYNAGEKAVLAYNGIPPYKETQAYVQRVLRYFQDYRNARNKGKAGS